MLAFSFFLALSSFEGQGFVAGAVPRHLCEEPENSQGNFSSRMKGLIFSRETCNGQQYLGVLLGERSNQ